MDVVTEAAPQYRHPEGGTHPITWGGNGKDTGTTAFWELYHQEARAACVPTKVAQGLAQNGDWATACQGLKTLIAGSAS